MFFHSIWHFSSKHWFEAKIEIKIRENYACVSNRKWKCSYTYTNKQWLITNTTQHSTALLRVLRNYTLLHFSNICFKKVCKKPFSNYTFVRFSENVFVKTIRESASPLISRKNVNIDVFLQKLVSFSVSFSKMYVITPFWSNTNNFFSKFLEIGV